MIVLGSFAANLRGISVGRPLTDVDITGTVTELEEFRQTNRKYFASEEHLEEEWSHFHLRDGAAPYQKIEFRLDQDRSDRLLLNMANNDQARVLDSIVNIASPNILYLTKRSHLNFPKNWEKHFADFIKLMKHVTPFSEAELEYCKQRKSETEERFKSIPRFKLSVSNDEFFRVSDHIRTYVHDDIHKAIAFEQGRPMYERCKADLESANLRRDLFEALPYQEQLRLPQEEFIVVGIERFYLHDRSMVKRAVYVKGLMKTVKDLSRGWFQDFCLDNIQTLFESPSHDFIGRFETAERDGQLRLVSMPTSKVLSKELNHSHQLRKAGLLKQAMMKCEELLKVSSDNPAVFLEMGAILIQGKKPELAERFIRRSLNIDSNNAAAWNSLGIALRLQGKTHDGIACFKAALSREPNFVQSQLNLAASLEQLNQVREAISIYRKALRLQPNQPAIRKRVEHLLRASAEFQ